MAFHTYEELLTLGEQIRDTAAKVGARTESDYEYQILSQQYPGAALLNSNLTSSGSAPNQMFDLDALNQYARLQYSFIPGAFTDFSTEDPAGSQPAIDALWSAAYALQPSLRANPDKSGAPHIPVPGGAYRPSVTAGQRLENITNVRLKAWHGPGADHFQTELIAPLNQAVPLQSEMAALLAWVLEINKSIRDALHNDIWTLGTETLKVLESMLGFHCSTPSGTVVLTVADAAMGVILAVPTDGWSLEAAYGFAGALIGFKNSVPNDSPTTSHDIKASTVHEVVLKMIQVMGQIRSDLDKQYQPLNDLLKQVQSLADFQSMGPQLGADLKALGGATVEQLTDRNPLAPLRFADS
jgi:hypothetical protein